MCTARDAHELPPKPLGPLVAPPGNWVNKTPTGRATVMKLCVFMPPNGPRCISGATGIGNTATWRNGEFPVPVGLVIRLKHRGARVVPMGVFVALGVLVAGGHQVGAIGEVYTAKC